MGDQNNSNADRNIEITEEEKSVKRSNYMFERGVIPPCRQMFYQYKDIKLDEAQNLVQSKMKKSMPKETQICSERNGWFEAGLDAGLREIMTKSITQSLTSTLKRTPSSELKSQSEQM